MEISETTVSRLSFYSRTLTNIETQQIEWISSGAIAEVTGYTSAQVRKDLACFGNVGIRGVGYNVFRLNEKIKKNLGLTQPHKMILIGAGHLGAALSRYSGFREHGFQFIAVFDNDPNKVGLFLGEIPIYNIGEMVDFIQKQHITIAFITVPACAVQDVVDLLMKTKIRGILNFSSTILNVSEKISVRNVDLMTDLEMLAYHIENKEKTIKL